MQHQFLDIFKSFNSFQQELLKKPHVVPDLNVKWDLAELCEQFVPSFEDLGFLFWWLVGW